jgi:hypothetical protein
MLAGVAADALVLIHLAFIIYVVVGGLLALRWPRAAWLHLPAMLWGAYVEFAGSVCPLTPLEQALRERAGGQSYSGGFIEHYVMPLIYPGEITERTGLLLGLGVLVVNAVVYALVVAKRRQEGRWPFAARMR